MSRLLLIIVLSVAFFISVFSMIKKKKIRIYEMIVAISCISILSIDMVFNFIRTPREKLSNETIEIIQETDWSDSAYLSRIGFELYDNTYKLEKRYDDGFFVIYVEDYSDSDLPNPVSYTHLTYLKRKHQLPQYLFQWQQLYCYPHE